MLGYIKPFNAITKQEMDAVSDAVQLTLSGYLAGRERSSGYYVTKLEEEWADVFRVKHAIACNSCTSGLLAACAVSNVAHGSNVLVPAISMSATAAVAKFRGANIIFGDIDPGDFNLAGCPSGCDIKAIIVTNLFGHPARLQNLKRQCDERGIKLIEDNAQAILAMENGQYTGTIGHIGVFSLNVHKHLQCGEGGVICTNDDGAAHELRGFINHGENLGLSVGLNLRMPELCAAVALEQLRRASEIVGSRVEQAQKLIAATQGVPGMSTPPTREGCTHSYYHVAWRAKEPATWANLFPKLKMNGFPVRRYGEPLYDIPALKNGDFCFEAEMMWAQVFIFENCAWDLTDEQIEKIGELFHSK